MKLFALFCLFLVLTARKCFAGIIIQTNKLDEDFIRKATVSSSVLDFYSYITHTLIRALVQKIIAIILFYFFGKIRSYFSRT